MQIVHLIPSAFNYFDDIRSQAFNVVEALDHQGITQQVFTLQYSAPSREVRSNIKIITSDKRTYGGAQSLNTILNSLHQEDILHLHYPFLGGGKQILKWKQAHLTIPLVITFYRKFTTTDLLSWFIKYYNEYYASKIFKFSSAILYVDKDSLKIIHKYVGLNREQIIYKQLEQAPLTSFHDTVQLSSEYFLIENIINTYKIVLSKN